MNNLHHTLWTARNYKKAGGEPELLRQHWAMKHRTEVGIHNELHANIRPLPVISKGLAIVALDHLSRTANIGKQESFNSVIERFYRLSGRMGQQAVEAGLFADHLLRQQEYLYGME